MIRADRPTLIMRLQPTPGVELTRELRLVLKTLLRRHGLRCVELRIEAREENERTC